MPVKQRSRETTSRSNGTTISAQRHGTSHIHVRQHSAKKETAVNRFEHAQKMSRKSKSTPSRDDASFNTM
ncbi:hypothetical protein BC628DRAFT_1392958 [Trametes gibbosa]|nr:hypothetical protein BC628DRAFT_1392958 [Trametes gibbosa]